MKIELFHIDDCPSMTGALENLRAALALEKMDADVQLVKVENDAQAERLRFLGSPSFRLEGADLWPEQRKRYNLSCRVYATPQGLQGALTVAMLREKLRLISK